MKSQNSSTRPPDGHQTIAVRSEQKEGERSADLKIIFQGMWGSGHREEAVRVGAPTQIGTGESKIIARKMGV